MLKTNSKQARENIKKYIIEWFDFSNYPDEKHPQTYSEIAHRIYKEFINQYWSCLEDYRYYKTEENAFINWCSGLPSILNTCYYYNRSAIDDLGKILEETDHEKSRFTMVQAETMLSKLIYREIKSEVTK